LRNPQKSAIYWLISLPGVAPCFTLFQHFWGPRWGPHPCFGPNLANARPPDHAQIPRNQRVSIRRHPLQKKGLYLLIKPNGSKLWYFKYRFGGKEKKMPIGQFPEIGLAHARRIRDVARVKIAEGLDPMLQRKRDKITAKINSANSFEVVALEYIDEKMVRQNLAEATLRKARWFLDLLKPAIGAMPIAEVDPHVFVRPGELRHAEWEEFDFDKLTWTIPEGKMKARRTHVVPLSRQVVALLRELQVVTGKKGYVFPSLYTAHRPMSENTVNVALRRLAFGKDEATAHGFRSTASTLLNESGKWHPDAIERALSHGDSNACVGHTTGATTGMNASAWRSGGAITSISCAKAARSSR
jgi:Phage integrase family/Arm DNA-binding domain